MTAREVLSTIDQMRPNAYTDAEKLRFLNVLEGRIYTEIYEASRREAGEDTPVFSPIKEGEEDREMSVPEPYTDLYIYYLAAMIDFYNGDSGRYNDSMVMYNDAWDKYAAYYIQRHKPKQTKITGLIYTARR